MDLAFMLVAAFLLYSVLVFLLKWQTCPVHGGASIGSFKDEVRATSRKYTLFISPDLWWARLFKERIKKKEENVGPSETLKRYVHANNRANLGLSIILAILTFIVHATFAGAFLSQLLIWMAVMRFLSRSVEIAYAFGRDVLQQDENATGLNKFERINLALFSYVELFIYSAAAYIALAPTPQKAIMMALNVGTLTNVGFAFPNQDVSFSTSLVFVQVFATLSLVVLSLASYLSREE